MSSLASMKYAVESLCNAKRLREALALIFHNPTGADYTLYSKLLDLCIDLKAKSHGHLIHAHLIKNDFPSSLHLNNKLIIFYSKFGEMEVAHMVFNGMLERNLVSWTALLSGYSKNGDSGEALGVFSTMHREGLKGNQFTYGSALRACTSLLCLDRGRQVQACIQKSRFVGNLFVQGALLDFHSKCGKVEDARFVFDSMSERDFISWNAMIGGYSFQGLDDDAFLMFQLMLREGMHPDCFTFGSILRNSFGSCRVAGLTKVNIIHGFIIQLGYETNNVLSGSLIDAYVKCGNLAGANCLYKNMKIKDTIACTALITGYAREGRSSDDCLELFSEIHRMHRGIDSVILCSMLNMCANSALPALGRQMHSLALKYQSNHDVALGNSLIDMYSKTGEIEDAKRTFDHMKVKNIISWTSMISAYGMHGRVEDAILLYKKMESQGIYPNDITFLSLFSACSHTGLTVEGWECFRNMIGKYKLLPRSEHYACMVDLLARGGCLEEAHDLICRGDIKPDASLWGSILGACSMYGNMSLGEVAAKHLFSMKPQESANYAVLANIYALGGLWQRASDVRELMVNRGLLKNPGYSFIQSKSNKIALVPAVQETDPTYIKVDCVGQGPGFFASATPQLDGLLLAIAKKVKDPDTEMMTIFEKETVTNQVMDIQRLSRVDSDFAPFLQHAGIPSIDMYYGKDFPVYHTAFDSYNLMVNSGDPLFHRHVAVTGVWGLNRLHLADADADDAILRFNYFSYARQLLGICSAFLF